MASEKKKVAPNSYKTDEAYKQKIYGVYLGQNKVPSLGLLNEYEFAAM
jgi:hypothetical protein